MPKSGKRGHKKTPKSKSKKASGLIAGAPAQQRPPSAQSLWQAWWEAITSLRAAFRYTATFLWFATIVAGLSVRTDLMGVSSIIRALNLKDKCYTALLKKFHTSGIDLDKLVVMWVQTVFRLFLNPVCVNGRHVFVGDGIKIPKSGRKMPAVKKLHQESESNTKPEFIMGHSLQSVGLLVHAGTSVFAVPLAARIHEGVVFSNRCRRTLIDKMLGLLGLLKINAPSYLVADAYYANKKVIAGLLREGHHLVSRVKSNAVAFEPVAKAAAKAKNNRGRPKVYGKKIKLKNLLHVNAKDRVAIKSPIYGDKDVDITYCFRDLFWRTAGVMVRYVAVFHPTRGKCILMSTDLTLDPIDIIRIYGWRYKIECGFKQAVRQIGAFAYHFWMKDMDPIKRHGGNQYLHRKSEDYRSRVARKIHAYHVFIQAGFIAQGLMHYLSVAFPDLVWKSFGSWLRTIRPGIPPSELVVTHALRNTLPEFLATNSKTSELADFILLRQNTNKMALFTLAEAA